MSNSLAEATPYLPAVLQRMNSTCKVLFRQTQPVYSGDRWCSPAAHSTFLAQVTLHSMPSSASTTSVESLGHYLELTYVSILNSWALQYIVKKCGQKLYFADFDPCEGSSFWQRGSNFLSSFSQDSFGGACIKYGSWWYILCFCNQ